MGVINIHVDNLSGGALPLFQFDNWPYPIFSINANGTEIIQSPTDQNRYMFGTFEISANDKEKVQNRLFSCIISLCEAAGFAGRCGVCIEADYLMSDRADRFLYILKVAIFFTADWCPELGGLKGSGICYYLPHEINEWDGMSPHLKDMATVISVIES